MADVGMTPQEQANRGHEAQRLLDSDLLKDALAAIDAEVVMQWEKCPARDKDGKEALWQLLKTSKKFQRLLLGYVQTGKLAQENLKRHEESKLDRIGRFVRRA
jgi:hypothetical protein